MYRDEQNMIFCENCGAPIPAGNAFCEECGTFVEYQDLQDHSGGSRKLVVALVAVVMVVAGCMSGLMLHKADAETADHQDKASSEQQYVSAEDQAADEDQALEVGADDPKAEAAYQKGQSMDYNGQPMNCNGQQIPIHLGKQAEQIHPGKAHLCVKQTRCRSKLDKGTIQKLTDFLRSASFHGCAYFQCKPSC